MSDWNARQYTKFEKQRTQPVIDLINRIRETNPKRILDIGCGPGNSTAMLRKYFPDADILGIDSSADMLEKAAKRHPELKFAKSVVPDDLGKLEGNFDLIFSNACIHWIPDHRRLIPAIADMLIFGGTLAVQIPLTDKQKFYRLLREIISRDKWRGKLGNIKNFHSLAPNEYYDVLCGISNDFDIWDTSYYHVVPSFESVIEWFRGSGLRPYLDALDENEKDDFIREISEEMSPFYHARCDGNIILRMPRLFFLLRSN